MLQDWSVRKAEIFKAQRILGLQADEVVHNVHYTRVDFSTLSLK